MIRHRGRLWGAKKNRVTIGRGALGGNSVEKGKSGPRDAFEQGAFGLRAGENPNAEQDAEQQTGKIFCDAVPRNGSFGLRRSGRSAEKTLRLGKAGRGGGAFLPFW